MNFLVHVLREILFFFNEVSLYLLFGFVIAGVLHVLFPDSIIRRHLGHNTFGSVIKSTLFGIPLPLCSCGALPVAASLNKSGARGRNHFLPDRHATGGRGQLHDHLFTARMDIRSFPYCRIVDNGDNRRYYGQYYRQTGYVSIRGDFIE